LAATLYELIPRSGPGGSDELLGRFLEYVEGKNLKLYPAQETAILGVLEDCNLILNTPTGNHLLHHTRTRRYIAPDGEVCSFGLKQNKRQNSREQRKFRQLSADCPTNRRRRLAFAIEEASMGIG